ncbi:hypothetical protein DB2_15 [Octadecabacter Antarctic DB virus 2]|nr:hypothetical protein DB2_15 [Octadecabacter Antarctic DB virus 2]
MAVEIKSGNGTDVATVDALSKAIRVTNYASDGHEGLHSFPVAVATNSATQLNEFVLASINAEEYKFISIQLLGTWVATVTFEGSNDNTTFYSIATTDPSANATGQTTATANRIVKVPVLTKYIRARVSAYTSGTISATAFGHLDENSSGLISTLGTVTIGDGPTETYEQVITAATENETSVTTGPTRLRTFALVNGVATLRYFKLYDKASAPVAGTDTPVATITMSPNSESGFTLPGGGLQFSLGLAYAMTLGVANSDTTADSVVGAITGILGYTE